MSEAPAGPQEAVAAGLREAARQFADASAALGRVARQARGMAAAQSLLQGLPGSVLQFAELAAARRADLDRLTRLLAMRSAEQVEREGSADALQAELIELQLALSRTTPAGPMSLCRLYRVLVLTPAPVLSLGELQASAAWLAERSAASVRAGVNSLSAGLASMRSQSSASAVPPVPAVCQGMCSPSRACDPSPCPSTCPGPRP